MNEQREKPDGVSRCQHARRIAAWLSSVLVSILFSPKLTVQQVLA
ncbi:MAG: hypothetical protein O7D30_01155 [Rickettsia endosymbiont of Ixodes persulcatus]|nr:hypothetical protein [Rickettsia endosymbiont of Ixodes persulcatus]